MAHHVIPPRVYVVVYLALLLLTASTLAVAFLELGSWHVWVGLAIAFAKATLVIFFFMHVFYSNKLTWVVALSGLLWLAILFGYVLSDYLTRGWLGVPGREASDYDSSKGTGPSQRFVRKDPVTL